MLAGSLRLSNALVFRNAGFAEIKSLVLTFPHSIYFCHRLFGAKPASKYFDALSTFVNTITEWLQPITVSPSQYPIAVFNSANLGRNQNRADLGFHLDTDQQFSL